MRISSTKASPSRAAGKNYQKCPRLQRPVLLVPGGKSIEKGLPWIIRTLTKGRENHFAGSYHLDKVSELERGMREKPDGNVFFMHHKEVFGTIENNARDIGRAIADIKRLTGAEQVDVIGECRGALEAREYVRQGGDGIRNLIEVTPPNRGFPVQGNLAWLVSKLWPGEEWNGYPLQGQGREALGSFRLDWHAGPVKGNPVLRNLNSRENLAQEKESLNSITVLAGDGLNYGQTDKSWFPGFSMPFVQGDGSVPLWGAVQPNADNFVYTGENTGHQSLNRNKEALAKLREVLLTDGHPEKDEHYLEDLPSFASAQLQGAAWLGSLAGRGTMAGMAATGAAVGPVGMAVGAVTAGYLGWQAVSQTADVIQGRAYRGPARESVGAAASLAQAAGVVSVMAGAPQVGLGLLGAGFAVGLLSS